MKNYIQSFVKDDTESRSRFIESHMPLVVSIARKKMDRGMDFEDMVQEGILGLVTAADKFDPDRGFRFSTYATWWIRQAIDDAILKHGDTVKKPSNYASHLKNLLKVRKKLEKKLARRPSLDEVAQEASMDPSMVRQILSLIPGTVSLDTPISEKEESSSKYLDVLEDRVNAGPDEECIFGRLQEDIDTALGTLSDKEKSIMKLRFGLESGEGRSLREVGRIFQLSPERIRQIEESSLVKLRNSDAKRLLREYLN